MGFWGFGVKGAVCGGGVKEGVEDLLDLGQLGV